MSKFDKLELEVTTYTPSVSPNSSFAVICSATGNPIGVTRKPGWQLLQYNYSLTIFEERYNILSFIGGEVGMTYTR